MLFISVTSENQTKSFQHPQGQLEFGRGPERDMMPRHLIEDRKVSRDHLRAEELGDGLLRLQNLSTRNPVAFADGTTIPPGGVREMPLPISVRIGDSIIDFKNKKPTAPNAAAALARVTGSADNADVKGTAAAEVRDELLFSTGPGLEEDGYDSLHPVQSGFAIKALSGPKARVESPSPETLANWMETILALQRMETTAGEFYAETARALVTVIGLDVGLVLLRREHSWVVGARAVQDDDRNVGPQGREFSQTVLRYVLQKKQTYFQNFGKADSVQSLVSVDAVVVSPIFGLHEEVVGALYGLRKLDDAAIGCRISPLEAQLVQVLAAAVGAYVARNQATRTRTQFEQFFSPELVRELQSDPALLDGREQNVTVLISDLRNFTSLSEHLGSDDICRLIRDVMECQSQRIHQHAGVIVSFMGDGILAMWNAPAEQPNHAHLACEAALAIQRDLVELNRNWQTKIGQPLALGIGINTGNAQVGNIGSSRKFMYGPLGSTVNLASRVAGATKHLRIPILITRSTCSELGKEMATRRLCQVRMVGIHEAIDLYELHGKEASADWRTFRDIYEAALALFESGDWLKTCQTLLPLLEQKGQHSAYDQPTLKLMNRSWFCLETAPDPFIPVLELSTK
jgi:adenylate cyclase